MWKNGIILKIFQIIVVLYVPNEYNKPFWNYLADNVFIFLYIEKKS